MGDLLIAPASHVTVSGQIMVDIQRVRLGASGYSHGRHFCSQSTAKTSWDSQGGFGLRVSRCEFARGLLLLRGTKAYVLFESNRQKIVGWRACQLWLYVRTALILGPIR